MKHRQLLSLLVLFFLVVAALSACNLIISPKETAAPPTPDPLAGKTIIAAGFQQPRQIMYTSDGSLYIAEAGKGGETLIAVEAPREGAITVRAGLTSQLTRVAPDGAKSVALPALPSIQTHPDDTSFRGGQAIYVTEDSYWIGFGEGPSQKSVLGLPFFRTVVEFDKTTWRILNVIDTLAAATENGQPSTDAINSDPVDLAMTDDGTLLIADAGCNCLWAWSDDGVLTAAALWNAEDNPVPTGVDMGPDGDIYISFLSGFPFEPGAARIERWSNGARKQTYGGLNMLTDLLVTDDGSIYAVQYATRNEQGFIPNSGAVLKVDANGATPVLEGLPSPYSLAQAPDGTLVVSVYADNDIEGKGAIVKVE